MHVTSVGNGITIFEEINFGTVKEFDIQLYILGHGRDYTNIVYWVGIFGSLGIREQDMDFKKLGV